MWRCFNLHFQPVEDVISTSDYDVTSTSFQPILPTGMFFKQLLFREQNVTAGFTAITTKGCPILLLPIFFIFAAEYVLITELEVLLD